MCQCLRLLECRNGTTLTIEYNRRQGCPVCQIKSNHILSGHIITALNDVMWHDKIFNSDRSTQDRFACLKMLRAVMDKKWATWRESGTRKIVCGSHTSVCNFCSSAAHLIGQAQMISWRGNWPHLPTHLIWRCFRGVKPLVNITSRQDTFVLTCLRQKVSFYVCEHPQSISGLIPSAKTTYTYHTPTVAVLICTH